MEYLIYEAGTSAVVPVQWNSASKNFQYTWRSVVAPRLSFYGAAEVSPEHTS